MTAALQPERLDFPPLHCSLAQPLGDYYQDFRAAIALVEGGYHGSLDAGGVPTVVIAGEHHYFAVTIAQYALANASAVLAGERNRLTQLRRLCDWLVQHQQLSPGDHGRWTIGFDNRKYAWLRAPWVSALAQGNAISALLRGAELLGIDAYVEAARAGYEALHAHSRPSLALESADDLWYEEYPAATPLHVLNGHVYTLFGVLDVARALGDASARDRWARGVRTAARHLEQFDLGYWSAYDLRTREPVSTHYHKNIHLPQLRILAALDGDQRFAAVADRWEGYLASPLSRARHALGMRIHGWRRRLGLLAAA